MIELSQMAPMFGGRGMRFGGGFRHISNPRVSDLSGLDSHFQSISAELREQYTVPYASAGGARPHQIRLEGLRDFRSGSSPRPK